MAQRAHADVPHEVRNVIGEPAPTADAPAREFEPLTVEETLDSLSSPARRMQATLGREFGAVEAEGEPWPLRRTVAFVTITCGAFWTAVYLVVRALVG
jgi:hypothetical protein